MKNKEYNHLKGSLMMLARFLAHLSCFPGMNFLGNTITLMIYVSDHPELEAKLTPILMEFAKREIPDKVDKPKKDKKKTEGFTPVDIKKLSEEVDSFIPSSHNEMISYLLGKNLSLN